MEGLINKNRVAHIYLNNQDVSALGEDHRVEGHVIATYGQCKPIPASVEIRRDSPSRADGTYRRVGRSDRKRTVEVILSPSELAHIEGNHVVETIFGSQAVKKAFVLKEGVLG